MYSNLYKLEEAINCFGLSPPLHNENEIKKAYRKLSMLHHPDKGGNVEEMKKINGYKTLLDNSFHQLNNNYSKTKKENNEVKKEKYEDRYKQKSYKEKETKIGIKYFINYIVDFIINIPYLILYIIFYPIWIILKYTFIFFIYVSILFTYLFFFILALGFFGKILNIIEPGYIQGGDTMIATSLFLKLMIILIILIIFYSLIYYRYIKKPLLNKVNQLISKIGNTKIITKKVKDIENLSNILKVVSYKGIYYFIGLYITTYIFVYFIYLIN